MCLVSFNLQMILHELPCWRLFWRRWEDLRVDSQSRPRCWSPAPLSPSPEWWSLAWGSCQYDTHTQRIKSYIINWEFCNGMFNVKQEVGVLLPRWCHSLWFHWPDLWIGAGGGATGQTLHLTGYGTDVGVGNHLSITDGHCQTFKANKWLALESVFSSI